VIKSTLTIETILKVALEEVEIKVRKERDKLTMVVVEIEEKDKTEEKDNKIMKDLWILPTWDKNKVVRVKLLASAQEWREDKDLADLERKVCKCRNINNKEVAGALIIEDLKRRVVRVMKKMIIKIKSNNRHNSNKLPRLPKQNEVKSIISLSR
jgi:hypothetical protein